MSSTLAQFGFFAELRRLRQLLDAAKNHISELQENLDAKQEWIARLRNNLEAAAEDSTEMMRQRDLARQDAETAEAKLAEIEKYASGERLVPLFPESRNYESREEWTLEWIRRVALAQIDAPKHPDKSLPLAKDLTGSDPDFTGDLSTDEYIRSIRGSAPWNNDALTLLRELSGGNGLSLSPMQPCGSPTNLQHTRQQSYYSADLASLGHQNMRWLLGRAIRSG
jgi:hypothetical protein